MRSKYHIIVPVLVLFSLLGGCVSSNRSPINKLYEERTILWDIGDRGAKSALWGCPERGFWKKIWPSLPMCNSGSPWIERDADLIFIGWSQENPEARVVLVTFNAGSAFDLSPQIISSAAEAGLIGDHWRPGFDFNFDGLKREGESVSVVLVSAYSSVFKGKSQIIVPIPPELLKSSTK